MLRSTSKISYSLIAQTYLDVISFKEQLIKELITKSSEGKCNETLKKSGLHLSLPVRNEYSYYSSLAGYSILNYFY